MSFKVTKLTVGKGKTIGDEKDQKWLRQYYEVEATIQAENQIELAKESIETLIDTWLKGELINKPQTGPVAVREETFSILKFQPQQGAKIGEYEVAYKANNLETAWYHAFNILRNSNATIKDRYHGEEYQFGYWLYDQDKIYRQKPKPKQA